MSDIAGPWTIERVCAALGNHPDINKRIWSEINKATEEQLPAVFARWRALAEETLANVTRAREALANGSLYDSTVELSLDDLNSRAERLRRNVA